MDFHFWNVLMFKLEIADMRIKGLWTHVQDYFVVLNQKHEK